MSETPFGNPLASAVGEPLKMTDWPDFRAAVDNVLAVVYGGPALPFQLKLEVFTMASVASGCRHCQAHGAFMLSSFGVDVQRIQAIWVSSTSPLFDDAERAALDFAFAAGQTPNATTPEHFANLAEHYNREQILELVGSVTAAAMFNRWNETVATITDDDSVEWATEHLSKVGWEIGKHAAAAD
jgi:alkylhydroperoxidase family enzyme